MYAAGKRLEDTTNVIAEAVAVEGGIQYCVDHQLLPLIVETDSLTMQKILDGIWEVPWRISLVVKRIQRLREGKQIGVAHVLREGNSLADFFTNLVFDFTGTMQFHNFQEVPSIGIKIINMEKTQTPKIRIRTKEQL